MNQFDIALNNGTIIDEKGNVKKNQSIGINKGKIIYIGEKKITAEKNVDCTNKIITSTFANIHAHSPMNILKGLAEDVSIDEWFNDNIWAYESNLIPADIEIGAKLGIMEMINNGVSVFAEHYFHEDAIIKAVQETGIRVDLAPTIFSGEDFSERIDQTLALKEKYEENDNIDISWGPHSTYMCKPKDLETISELAQTHDMKVHIHISETSEQLKEHKNIYDETPVKTLERVGLLNQRLIVAHSLHMEEEDFELYNRNHFIALSPKTYMKLAMDLDKLIKKLDKIEWGIGTDGGASSNTLNIIEQAQLLALSLKHTEKDATLLNVKQLWKKIMGTHRALDFDTGIIKEDAAADLIIWDLNKVNTLPNHNLLASIIYSSNSENIESVIVNGQFLKEDSKVRGFDDEFIQQVNKQKDRILKVGKSENRLQY